jgi:hypothetical protein
MKRWVRTTDEELSDLVALKDVMQARRVPENVVEA